MTRIVILGSGPSGLGAAYRLAKSGRANVTVLEQSTAVGGNAGSFELAGLTCDYGSHRLHPSTPPDVMADIQALLGDDLLKRPRHGRIRLMGRLDEELERALNPIAMTEPGGEGSAGG